MIVIVVAMDRERWGHAMVENDLAELKGIGPKHAEMLKSIGVDSIKELRHRNAAKLKEMIETRHGKVVGLSEKTVQTWIEEAKDHAS
jgi:predicted flap endonuclease-1-like 5' DNA nuclease